MVFGLQTQPKSWLTGYTFWVNHYLEIVFSKISVVNPPPLIECSIDSSDEGMIVWTAGSVEENLQTFAGKHWTSIQPSSVNQDGKICF